MSNLLILRLPHGRFFTGKGQFFQISLLFSLLAGNCRGDAFAADCVHSQISLVATCPRAPPRTGGDRRGFSGLNGWRKRAAAAPFPTAVRSQEARQAPLFARSRSANSRPQAHPSATEEALTILAVAAMSRSVDAAGKGTLAEPRGWFLSGAPQSPWSEQEQARCRQDKAVEPGRGRN